MTQPGPLLRRRLKIATMVTALPLLLAGCTSTLAATYTDSFSGAVITGASEATAGTPFAVTASGRIGAGDKCPTSLTISYDEIGTNPFSLSAQREATTHRIDKPATTQAGAVCSLTPLVRNVTIPALGTTARKVRVTVLLSNLSGVQYLNSNTSYEVTVAPAAAGGATSGGGTPPVAEFFARQVPAVVGRPVALDASESTDPDGRLVKYSWDFGGDGKEDAATTEPITTIPGSAMTTPNEGYVVKLRVTDDKGNVSGRDHTVTVRASGVSSGDLTAGTATIRVGQDVQFVPGAVPEADIATLDKDNDNQFDDGSLSAPDINGSTHFRFPDQVQFQLSGLRRVAVAYFSASGAFLTRVTKLFRVEPAAAAAAAKASFPLRFTTGKLKRRGTLADAGAGKARVTGAVVNGTVKGKLPAKAPAALKAGLRALGDARFAMRFDGTAAPLGSDVALAGKGTLLIRARKDARTQLCLRLTTPGAGTGRYTVLGATGRATGLRSSGSLPAAVFSLRGAASADALTLATSKGAAKALPAACRALAKDLR
jgi:hypothetical protein